MSTSSDGGADTGSSPKNKPSSKTYSQKKWEKLMNSGAIPQSVIKDLVMEYFFCEGYIESAKHFQHETFIGQEKYNLDELLERNEIRNMVLQGNMESAINSVNKLVPQALEANPALLFRLYKHMLIDKIRNKKTGEAIEFAQKKLAPIVQESDQVVLRKELEEVLSLLIFDDLENSPLAHLLNEDELQETAQRLNAAILKHQGKEAEPRLIKLLQEAQWSKDELESKGFSIPKVLK